MTTQTETTVRMGQWLVIAGQSGGGRGRALPGSSNRGELISVHDTEPAARSAARRCGIHRSQIAICEAGECRTPRGARLASEAL